MQNAAFQEANIRPIFSGHETFPVRYGWLKKVYDAVLQIENKGLDAKYIFNNPEAISIFGVGKNMVSSMRYWATHTQILQNNKLTDFAKRFLDDDGLDPWMENPTTLWLLHWHLICNPSLVTYYWVFNNFNASSFDREVLNEGLIELCHDRKIKPPSPTTLKRDIDCFIRMYANKNSYFQSYNDEVIEAPFSDLALIKPTSRNSFKLNRGKKSSLTVGMFLYALVKFWENRFSDASSLSLETMLYEPTSPGRVFLLDENSLFEKIQECSLALPNYLKWSETAGIQQFSKSVNIDFSMLQTKAYELIQNEYKNK